MGRLDGHVAVITGAGSGIGAETARRFVAEGARVVVADLRADGEAVAQALGDAARFVQADVSKEADVQAMIARATDTWGRLDCLYNNAGFGGALGPIDTTSVEDYDLTFDVLLKSVFLGIKHASSAPRARPPSSTAVRHTSTPWPRRQW
jgi:NAD(P)-dependent dehydrogenase (short-subunit alcohol dehydrogenase family)